MSQKLFVWVIGANGSGKSAWGKRLQKLDPKAYTITGDITPGKTLGTLYPCLGWAAIGRYTLKCCGSDTIKRLDQLAEVVKLIAEFPYHIYIEGMAFQLSRERWWKRMNEVIQATNREGLIVGLDYPYEVTLSRYLARNNGKAEKGVRKKFENAKRTFDIFESRCANGPISFHHEKTEGLYEMLVSMQSVMERLVGGSVFTAPRTGGNPRAYQL